MRLFAKINILILSFIAFLLFHPIAGAQYAIRNGQSLPASDTLRALLLFAEVDYQAGPCPGGFGEKFNNGWKKLADGNTGLPANADRYFNQEASQSKGYISNYYYEASFGNYVILGDYYPDVITVPCHRVPVGNSGLDAVLSVLDTLEDDTTVYTAHGYHLRDFDQWTMTAPGLPKVKNPDGNIDIVYIIWRNNRFIAHTNTGDNSGFGVTPAKGRKIKRMNGVNNVTSYNNSMGDDAGFHITIAEHLHGIFGGNHWHTGGGRGNHTFIAAPLNYGATAQLAATMYAVSGWDRWMMGWKRPAKKFLISALDSLQRETNTEDFSLSTFPAGGVFYLRDHVTSGDAIRIRLPHIDYRKEGDVKNQYLWLEFRELKTTYDQYMNGDACLDHNDGRFPNGTPGLYAYIQVGKDIREGTSDINTSRIAHPNGLASFLMPLTAEGNHDFSYRYDRVHNGFPGCGSWGNRSLPEDPTRRIANPFTGFSDLYRITDSNFDGKLFSGDDLQPGLSEMREDSVWFNYHCSGDWQDAFSFATGNTVMNLGTNPAPVPVYTYAVDYEYERFHFSANASKSSFENRTIWLNGLEIEILEENLFAAGERAIRLRIRWDRYAVSNDVRWCGNIVLNANHQDPSSPSLILEKGKTILLDRGTSPTRHLADPFTDTTQIWFTDTTIFTVVKDAQILLQPRSRIILEAGSRLLIKSGGRLKMGEKSRIIVSKGSKFAVEEGAIIEKAPNAKIIFK